ncbi:unnamed protein product [Candidula unifasciata]|uniref:Uncharacterized protein n=1 Tax=Candidula unifasciata TaxID=100452 RepID=A0A8S3YP05_9EUPU|nr:unnamed protein product [Candidula unifasciata]
MAARDKAKLYLAEHRIPQLFESLLSCLMMERPENPVSYIEDKMCEIREIGLENINWETLIAHFHPYRNNVRRHFIRDGSVYDKEYSDIIGESKDFEQRKKQNYEFPSQERFEPEVFQLTEAHS